MQVIDRRAQTSSITQDRNGRSILTRRGSTTRSRERIDAIVLHQMSFSRGSGTERFDTVIAHFAVLLDGTVLQLRNYEDILNDAYGGRGVEIEFEGHFPCGGRGHGGVLLPTAVQIVSGRELAAQIVNDLGTVRGIYAHRHFNPEQKGCCPGPHVWFNVGEWAARSMNLNTSPAGARGSIPDSWRDSSLQIVS